MLQEIGNPYHVKPGASYHAHPQTGAPSQPPQGPLSEDAVYGSPGHLSVALQKFAQAAEDLRTPNLSAKESNRILRDALRHAVELLPAYAEGRLDGLIATHNSVEPGFSELNIGGALDALLDVPLSRGT